MFSDMFSMLAGGSAPISSKQAAKVASLDGAGFFDPFAAEKARAGADKMNNLIAMYTR
jgi:hypothetical protein